MAAPLPIDIVAHKQAVISGNTEVSQSIADTMYGALGVIAVTVTVLSSHRKTVPAGAAGGQPGQTGINLVERANGTSVQLSGNDEVEIAEGDIFVMKTPGGGYGIE